MFFSQSRQQTPDQHGTTRRRLAIFKSAGDLAAAPILSIHFNLTRLRELCESRKTTERRLAALRSARVSSEITPTPVLSISFNLTRLRELCESRKTTERRLAALRSAHELHKATKLTTPLDGNRTIARLVAQLTGPIIDVIFENRVFANWLSVALTPSDAPFANLHHELGDISGTMHRERHQPSAKLEDALSLLAITRRILRSSTLEANEKLATLVPRLDALIRSLSEPIPILTPGSTHLPPLLMELSLLTGEIKAIVDEIKAFEPITFSILIGRFAEITSRSVTPRDLPRIAKALSAQ